MDKPKIKRLYLIRHAHRDTLNRIDDNGLSEKGKIQADILRKYFKKICEDVNGSLRFISSPKLRCLETLSPLASEFNFVIEIDERLDEGSFEEDSIAFVKRIAQFMNEISQNPNHNSLVFLCSHGDWIPEAMRAISGAEIDLEKAGFIELEYKKEGLKVVNVTQVLDSP